MFGWAQERVRKVNESWRERREKDHRDKLDRATTAVRQALRSANSSQAYYLVRERYMGFLVELCDEFPALDLHKVIQQENDPYDDGFTLCEEVTDQFTLVLWVDEARLDTFLTLIRSDRLNLMRQERIILDDPFLEIPLLRLCPSVEVVWEVVQQMDRHRELFNTRYAKLSRGSLRGQPESPDALLRQCLEHRNPLFLKKYWAYDAERRRELARDEGSSSCSAVLSSSANAHREEGKEGDDTTASRSSGSSQNSVRSQHDVDQDGDPLSTSVVNPMVRGEDSFDPTGEGLTQRK